jgi:hypothetical protein
MQCLIWSLLLTLKRSGAYLDSLFEEFIHIVHLQAQITSILFPLWRSLEYQ